MWMKLQQLQQVLKTDPKNANVLFNLGMMKWKGKDDAAGAIATSMGHCASSQGSQPSLQVWLCAV